MCSLFSQYLFPPSEFLLPSSLSRPASHLSIQPRLLLAASSWQVWHHSPYRGILVGKVHLFSPGHVMAIGQLRMSTPGSKLVSDSLSRYLCLDARLACAPEQRARKQGLMGMVTMGMVMKTNRKQKQSPSQHYAPVPPQLLVQLGYLMHPQGGDEGRTCWNLMQLSIKILSSIPLYLLDNVTLRAASL